MRALTLRQPHATMVAHGLVRFVRRGWPGERALGKIVAIHAGTDGALLRLGLHQVQPLRGALAPLGLTGPGSSALFPRGAVIATARLVGVHACADVRDRLSPLEHALDDWCDGWAWEFRFPHLVTPPAPADGQPGLWRWRAPGRRAV